MQAVLLSRFVLDLNEESTESDQGEASSSGSQFTDLQFTRVLGALATSVSYDPEIPAAWEPMEMYDASLSENRMSQGLV